MKIVLKKCILLISFFNFSIYSQEFLTIPENMFEVPNRRDFNLNHLISPCEDFFSYVCSDEISKFRIPETKNKYIFSFDDSAERIKQKRINYVQSLLSQTNLNKRSKMIKNFYNSCMNESKRLLDEKKLVNDNLELISFLNKDEILQLFAKDSINGEGDLIIVSDLFNKLDKNLKDIIFSYSMNLEAKEYYTDKELLDEYKSLINKYFKDIGVNDSEKLSNFVINFEFQIAEVSPSNEDFSDVIAEDNIVSREFLINEYKNLYFQIMLEKIPKNIKVNLVTKEVMSKINSLLEDATVEEVRALAFWNKVNLLFLKYSHPDLYNKVRVFNNKHFGRSLADSEKSIHCTIETSGYLERSIDFEIVKNDYKDFPVHRIKNIVSKVRQASVEKIKNNKWLSENTKNKAVSKIENIKFKLVKPQNITEWNLEPIINLSDDMFITNIRRITTANMRKLLKNINKNDKIERWQMSPLSPNAYYEFSYNHFVLPLGILHPPFYDDTKSDIINLGSLGMIVGHEIGHAIDEIGSKYDQNGSLSQWVSDNDLKKFKRKSKKMISFFNNDGVNGKLTLGENIADQFGLNNAFNAAFPNKKISDNQVKRDFFIQFGRLFCGVVQPKYKDYLLKTDDHAPVDVRINNQVRLSKNFEETFFCKKEDPMTLDDNERISLW
ncbi:M13 family metallopeptidase [Spirobacillus cienkowskii]|uniref:M13 family metallopeptidase n=1 Tax=Spirobacillus cienkowskii TaxID=495820 RepID=UPI0030D5151A